MENALQTQIQTEWKWPVAADLFLAGTGASAYVTGVLASYSGPVWEPVAKTGIALGFPLLILATFFLLLDLNVKKHAMWVFLHPGTSWITRGSLIISLFVILSAIHAGMMVWPGQSPADAPLLQWISPIAVVLAFLVMVYTGALMSASRPIAFWNTALLPLLFLVSALSTGSMIVALLTPSGPELAAILNLFAKVILLLLVLEGIAIIFYLQASHRTGESRASARFLLKGHLSKRFWLGVVVTGFVIPITLLLIAIRSDPALVSTMWLIRLACIPGLVGSFMLRLLILAAGVKAPLRAGGIEYSFPEPVKFSS